ncbi:MAG TPA: transglycosylase SLT domain-containing protein [Polyangiaceae bacterium]|nr:transglycosylase SLT domain-containing protein [Polyangiaceae bacterium]
MSRREAVAFALVIAAGCAKGASRAPGSVSDRGGAALVDASSIALDASAPHESASFEWSSLVRDGRWEAAWRALEALPSPDKGRAEVRYVRARVALARGDAVAALALLDGLETALPLLAADVERRRAEAKLVVGPFSEAGEWFVARATPAAQLDAAKAFEKADDVRRARVAVEHVLASDKRTRAQEGEARALRIRIASEPDEIERADARWLAVEGADLPAGSDAPGILAKIDPGRPLTAEDLLARARVLSDAGKTDEALRVLDMVPVARNADKVSRAERLHVRGMTLYKAHGRSGEAAKTLFAAASAGGPTAAEDAFHAARALSRADRDEEAIVAYEDVPRKYPRSSWAAEAEFFVPYLRMLHGDWKECARGFDAYLQGHPAGERAPDARPDSALCKLLAGEAKVARVLFEHLVEDEPDPISSARMANMAALAAYRDGDRTHAVARWTDVARSRPLSWPALVARARLAEAGAPVPLAIDPSDPPPSEPAPLDVVIPPPADLLAKLGLDEDAELALRDRESTLTSGAGPRAAEAACVAYGKLGRAKRRYQIAQSLPSALFASAPNARTLWAWDCAFPSPYGDVVRDAEDAEKLPRGLLWAVMRQESSFDPDALSPARAVGLMQLLPETARPLAEELQLPRDDSRLTRPSFSIRVAARALRKLLDELHGNVPLSLAAYNCGVDSVERWSSRAPSMDLDTFVERIPFKETRDYVVRVMGNLAHYEYLAGGAVAVPAIALAL